MVLCVMFVVSDWLRCVCLFLDWLYNCGSFVVGWFCVCVCVGFGVVMLGLCVRCFVCVIVLFGVLLFVCVFVCAWCVSVCLGLCVCVVCLVCCASMCYVGV